MLNAVTIAAIVAACWAHPQGQAYLAKIEQIDQLSISCGNPCCNQVSPSGGWVGYQYHQRTKTELEKERIRLGIIDPVAKKLTRVFRLSKQKEQLTEETFKAQAKLSGVEWKVEYGIYLALLRQIHNNAINMAKERELYYALEAFELRRIEEADIVFVIAMLASEIYT